VEEGSLHLRKRRNIMTMTTSQTVTRETSYGWFADALGGIATVVLAIVGLAGIHAETMISIATIVFGVALLIEGGTVLSEYANIIFPPGTLAMSPRLGGGSLSAVFLAGAAGILLGILALLGIHPATLTAIAAITFGSALLFSSNAVWHLHGLKQLAAPAREWRSGSDILVGEMAYGSIGMQALAGIAGIVLGILALVLTSSAVLTLSALVVLGATLTSTGTAASDAFLSLMRPHSDTTSTSRSSFGPAE
jgi:hypothetical protein